MVSIGRRVSIKAFEVGCNVPTIEVPSKPEHGEFGTPVAKRPIKAIFEFLNRAFQLGYFDQEDILKYVLMTDFPKLRKTASEKASHTHMNQVEKPIAAVKTQIVDG